MFDWIEIILSTFKNKVLQQKFKTINDFEVNEWTHLKLKKLVLASKYTLVVEPLRASPTPLS